MASKTTENPVDATLDVDTVAGVDGAPVDPVDPLAEYRASGGITLAEFTAADPVRLDDGSEVSSLALLAAGTHATDGRELVQGEREQYARRIDDAVRAFAAYLDSRSPIEQVSATLAPVIHIGPAE